MREGRKGGERGVREVREGERKGGERGCKGGERGREERR